MRRLSLTSRMMLALAPIVIVAGALIGYFAWTGATGRDVFSEFGLAADQTWFVVAGLAATLLAALVVTMSVIRSVVRKIESVTSAAVDTVDEDLTYIVESLRNPQQQQEYTSEFEPLDDDGRDELAALARSFNGLHDGLADLARHQADALSKGISEIFVTLARRNSSLVERQLALIDELEAREENAEVLGGYYRLDHLATRMRRNAESLLVMAGAESPRTWGKPTDMSQVVRAAVGEVDEYQRIEVLALEPARLSGGAVTDVSHLMSELLDNATQFSAPTESVRVAGLFDPDGYVLTVSDSGIGMSKARIAELNRVLEKPPALGLALEPTLGIYVVARLASRHGIGVQLVSGVPGITARVTVPSRLLEIARPTQLSGGHQENGAGESDHRGDRSRPAALIEFTSRRLSGDSPPPGAGRHESAEPPPPLTQRPTTSADPVSEDEPAPATAPFRNARPSVFARESGESASVDGSVGENPAGLNGSRAAEDAPREALPVREPGSSFGESDDDRGLSTQVSDGAFGIRSALSRYEAGREAASSADAADGDDDDDEASS